MKTIGIENSKSSVQAHLTLGTKTMGLGIYGAYLALAIIYFWFGGMKFTHYEAEGLVPLVSNSPLLGWVYSIFSVDMFSSLLGILEISIGTLIAGRMLSPKLSVVGGIPLHTSPRRAELSGVAGTLDKDGYLLQAQP